MKTTNFIVRIPEPCHEDWNGMTPDANGKFCSSCAKSVIDFSNKSDTEIRDILLEKKDQKVCGHFKKTQIDRPLNLRIDFNNLPKNVSTTKAFAIALFLVFGTFLFSCTTIEGKKVETIEIVNNTKEDFVEGEIKPMEQIAKEDTLKSLQTLSIKHCYSESYVAGGLSFETVEPVAPEIFKPEIVEQYTLGQMAIYVSAKDTSVTNDSLDIKATERALNPSVITKTTDLSIYPNPSTGDFTIKYDVLKRADVHVDIYNMAGALIKSVVNTAQQFEGKYQIPVSLNEFPNGIYIVDIINNGKRFSEKVIIER